MNICISAVQLMFPIFCNMIILTVCDKFAINIASKIFVPNVD